MLVKQVPVGESLELGSDGRLQRSDVELEMNAFCRRAVAKGVELAVKSGGDATAFTLGPPSAEGVLREAVAWGVARGVHLCDAEFRGSDTLATARALAAALREEGPFDLVLVGRNTTDGETGQVGPQIAELLDLPFAGGVRELELDDDVLCLGLEHDDGTETVQVRLPALISAAERLCSPCKVDVAGRRAVPSKRLSRLTAAELGPGPWGEPGSRTRVGAVRVVDRRRQRSIQDGDISSQVDAALRCIEERGAFAPPGERDEVRGGGDSAPGGGRTATRSDGRLAGHVAAGRGAGESERLIGALLEDPGSSSSAELVGEASRLAAEVGGKVVALCAPHRSRPHVNGEGHAGAGSEDARSDMTFDAFELGELGADQLLELKAMAGSTDALSAEDVAQGVRRWATSARPWAVVAPSTAFGREVAGRVAAALDAGLVGDAVGLRVVDGELVAAKPAFSGALVADITWESALRLVTVRPGVLPVPQPTRRTAKIMEFGVEPRRRVHTCSTKRDDDVEALARAGVVIGVGMGVTPDEYRQLSPLAELLGGELAATRKVTDQGWMPRSRQVGVTGRSISPRLYVAVGLSGKFNHMVGVRGAGTILAINVDRDAPVFGHADVGIVGDWHEVLPALVTQLRRRELGALTGTA